MNTKGQLSFFAGAVVLKLMEGGMLGVLAFSYAEPGKKPQMRLPGGGSVEGERPEQTLFTEFRDEVTEKGSLFSLDISKTQEIYRVTKISDSSERPGTHMKVFFLIPKVAVNFKRRREKRIEPDGVELSPPSWFEAEALVKQMLAERTPYHHVMAVLLSVKEAAKHLPEVAKQYCRTLADHEKFIQTSRK